MRYVPWTFYVNFFLLSSAFKRFHLHYFFLKILSQVLFFWAMCLTCLIYIIFSSYIGLFRSHLSANLYNPRRIFHELPQASTHSKFSLELWVRYTCLSSEKMNRPIAKPLPAYDNKGHITADKQTGTDTVPNSRPGFNAVKKLNCLKPHFLNTSRYFTTALFA